MQKYWLTGRRSFTQPDSAVEKVTPTWEHLLDKWLRRLSYLSQLGIAMFAAGVTFFIIMPLYKSAFLDEAIARKENEIRRVSISVDAAYLRRRSVIVRDFVRMTSAECAPLTLAASLVAVQQPQAPSSPDPSVPLSNASIATCLQKMVTAGSDIKELREADHNQLVQEIKLTGAALEEERRIAKAKFDDVPRIAKATPEALPRPSILDQQAIDFSTKFLTPDQVEKQVLNARMAAERHRIEAAYAGQITRHLTALEAMLWLPIKE